MRSVRDVLGWRPSRLLVGLVLAVVAASAGLALLEALELRPASRHSWPTHHQDADVAPADADVASADADVASSALEGGSSSSSSLGTLQCEDSEAEPQACLDATVEAAGGRLRVGQPRHCLPEGLGSLRVEGGLGRGSAALDRELHCLYDPDTQQPAEWGLGGYKGRVDDVAHQAIWQCLFYTDEAAVRRQREIEARLDAVQYPLVESCQGRRVLLYAHHPNGIGSELHMIHNALRVAYSTNRTLVIAESEGWIWVDKAECGGRTWSCLFEPLSTCEATGANAWSLDVPVIHTKDIHASDGERIVRFDELDDWGFGNRLPDEAQPWGLLFWRSVLTAWMYRPNAHVLANYEQFRRDNFVSNDRCGTAAAFIRNGDKATMKEEPEVSFDQANDLVQQFSDTCGLFTWLYMGTRDPRVCKDALYHNSKRNSSQAHYWFDTKQHRSGNGWSTGDLWFKQELNKTEEAMLAVRDVWFMAHREYFFGMFGSNFARLIIELGCGRHLFRLPPIALDDWSYHVNP